MEAFEYANPTTLAEALGLLGAGWNDSAVLAGGTDLISAMKDFVMSPKRLVNIKNIKELGGVAKGASLTHPECSPNARLDKRARSCWMRARIVSNGICPR